MSDVIHTPRRVTRLLAARDTSDGAGVRLKRSIGGPELDSLDPFLLLDEFRSDQPGDYLAGFPSHPHRGFETVTYMLAGQMEHRDHLGHRGLLDAGSVQWMTAGRGIIHSEMPRQENGLMWGFQLWVNLPASDKMCDPRYQDIPPDAIPEVTPSEGVLVRIVCGEAFGTPGAVTRIASAPLYCDVRLQPRRQLQLPVPEGHSAFVYAYDGAGEVGDADTATAVPHSTLAILGDGDGVQLSSGDAGFRALVIAGRPLKEPVVRYGPFVMNTRQQIQQAVDDYNRGVLTD